MRFFAEKKAKETLNISSMGVFDGREFGAGPNSLLHIYRLRG
jgi:hypothetical protein